MINKIIPQISIKKPSVVPVIKNASQKAETILSVEDSIIAPVERFAEEMTAEEYLKARNYLANLEMMYKSRHLPKDFK